ncbi:HAD-IIA family hydrolase [Nakamurella lactea]|uniref:HAD-IIA family hydrolase n=1 Tax=Nakamurella lactea TaxID=459515 RepID=UPI00048C2AC5|nr:HAD-IIA family hydrolase [Nakamurella lactea]
MRPLAETYDAALLDLDGTVYLGGTVIPFVPEALAAARAMGMATMFVTNNASRPPAVVAKSLSDMGIQASDDDVLTSPHVAAEMLAASHPAGARVLVVGAPYLHEAIAEVGLIPVEEAADEPVAVVQGHSPDTGWRQLAEACIALRAGVDWVACNSDSTLPTDRGLLPGNGAMVAALVAATGRRPRVAGKPARPLLDSAIERAGSKRPLVVGDRLDTDIEAAGVAGLPALMPLTGVNSASDLLLAPAHRRPTHVCLDLRGLTDPARVVALPDPRSTDAPAPGTEPAGWQVTRDDDLLTLSSTGEANTGDTAVLGALAALLAAAWSRPGAGEPIRVGAADAAAGKALDRLDISRADAQATAG